MLFRYLFALLLGIRNAFLFLFENTIFHWLFLAFFFFHAMCFRNFFANWFVNSDTTLLRYELTLIFLHVIAPLIRNLFAFLRQNIFAFSCILDVYFLNLDLRFILQTFFKKYFISKLLYFMNNFVFQNFVYVPFKLIFVYYGSTSLF